MSISTDALRSFHLRVLFPHILSLSKTDPRRLNAPPRITRSKPIDSELYTYIALLVRDFIHPWYRVVTNDQDFVAELVRILIVVIRELETRFCEQVSSQKGVWVDSLFSCKLLIKYIIRWIGQSLS